MVRALLPLLSTAKTRSISPENPTGQIGGGAKELPLADSPASDLGPGWKTKAWIALPKNSTTTLAEIKGPGVIKHIWLTINVNAYRSCILRFFWDDEKSPSVEVPLGDFFANGDGLRYNVNSLPVIVTPSGGFNCYWQMPFRKSCKITLENQYVEDIIGFYYQFTYELLFELPENTAYFHAQWRKSLVLPENPEYVILDNVEGKGHYIGTFLTCAFLTSKWWDEGEVKFFIDDDKIHPTICGTGIEDYFGSAWSFRSIPNGPYESYSTPFLGYFYHYTGDRDLPKHHLYRWHILDPIRFEKALRITIQALGWWPNKKFQPLLGEMASIGYWYQQEPHHLFPVFPELEQRWPR